MIRTRPTYDERGRPPDDAADERGRRVGDPAEPSSLGHRRRTGTPPRSRTRSSRAGRTAGRTEGTFHAANPTGPLADPERAALPKRGGARLLPVPVRRRAARRAPARLHRHRRVLALPAHDRPQRPAHDRVRRVRAAGRAVRRADRHPPARHHRGATWRSCPRQLRRHGHGPRPAPRGRHDRPGVLPLDAVDLHDDLRVLVRRAGRARPARSASWSTRTRPATVADAGRPAVDRADARPSSGRRWTAAGWRTCPTHR